MTDQASKLRVQVSKNKLEKVIDDAKRLSDIGDLYKEISEKRKARTFIFFSAKGGTGKTSIIESLTYTFLELEKDVAVIDLNREYSDIHTAVSSSYIVGLEKDDIDTSNNIVDIKDNKRLNIFKIENEESVMDSETIRLAILKINISGFDRILIDTPVMKSEDIVKIMDYTGVNVLITNADLISVENSMSLLISMDKKMNIKKSVALIFNKLTGDSQEVLDYFLKEVNNKLKNIILQEALFINRDIGMEKVNRIGSNRKKLFLESDFYKEIKQHFLEV